MGPGPLRPQRWRNSDLCGTDGSHDQTGRSTRVRRPRGRLCRHRGRRLSAQGPMALAAASVRGESRVIEVVDPGGARYDRCREPRPAGPGARSRRGVASCSCPAPCRRSRASPGPVAVGRPGGDGAAGGSGRATPVRCRRRPPGAEPDCAGGPQRLVRGARSRPARRVRGPGRRHPTALCAAYRAPAGGRPVPRRASWPTSSTPLPTWRPRRSPSAPTTTWTSLPPSRSGRPWASPNGCAPPRPETAGRAATVHTVGSPTGRWTSSPSGTSSPSLGRASTWKQPNRPLTDLRQAERPPGPGTFVTGPRA